MYARVATIQELRVEESIQGAFFQENRELSTLFWGNRFFSEWLETALKNAHFSYFDQSNTVHSSH